jgi:Zn-dependent alcohol dehydrogenase
MKYRRIVVTHFGGPEVLQVVEEELPDPGPGEVRIRVLAAGVSYADLLMREGVHPETLRPPFTPGWDLLGVVEKRGEDASHFNTGQMVAALTVTGAYSEFICLPQKELVPVPADLPANTFFVFIGEAAGRLLEITGVSFGNPTFLGAVLHYLIGLGLGVVFGAVYSQFSAPGVSHISKAILVGILTTEVVSIVLLVPAVIILEMGKTEIVELFCLATVFHFIYGATLGGLIGYGLKNQPATAVS